MTTTDPRTAHKLPTSIGGTRVEPAGDPLTVRGEEWLTLIPSDEDDERIWEFSLTTGRLLQTC
jgi:hypothetical protein